MAASWPARAQPFFPERPEGRVVVLDEAGMIDEGDRREIENVIDDTLIYTSIPIVVVTLQSRRSYAIGSMSIEQYARQLFNHWGIGLSGNNYGILLLIIKAERQARIELGAAWEHRKDRLCRKIMDQYIIACFKRGEYSRGIKEGVRALSAMIKDERLPSPPRSTWFYLLLAGLALFGGGSAWSFVRRGSDGWAWLIWGAFFSLLGALLHRGSSDSYRSGSRSGGYYQGGSFGGGFSSGGGASGSW